MTDPTDISQQIGELKGSVGAIESRLGSLEEGQREARVQSTKEHAEVRADFRTAVADMRADLTTRLNNHAGRIDSLESSRDKEQGAEGHRSGARRRVEFFLGFLLGLAGLVLSHFH